MSNLIEQASAYSWVNIDLRFRQDTELGHLVKRIQERMLVDIPAGLSPEELRQLTFQTMAKYFAETPEGQADMASIQDYGLRMHQMFSEAFDLLRGRVSEEVTTLSSQIMGRSEEYMNRRLGQTGLENASNPEPTTFTTLNVGQLDVADALATFMKKTNINVDAFRLSTCQFFVDKISTLRGISAELSDGVRADFKKSLDLRDSVMAEDIMKLFDALTKQNEGAHLRHFLFPAPVRVGKFGEPELRAWLGFCFCFPIFKKAVESFNFDLDEEVKKELDDNLETMDDMHTLAASYLELARQKYTGRLVIGPTLLNKEEFEKFKEAGGTQDDIRNHLRLHYNQNREDVLFHYTDHSAIPASGIDIKEVLVCKVDDAKKMADLQNEIKVQLLSVKQACTKDAFVDVLKQYVGDVKNSPELLPEKTDADIFVRRAVEHITHAGGNLIRSQQANVEDAVYDFYMKTWMSGTLVSTIYYQMGAEVISQLNDSTTMDADMMNRVHASVMSDILSSYLSKVFLLRA